MAVVAKVLARQTGVFVHGNQACVGGGGKNAFLALSAIGDIFKFVIGNAATVTKQAIRGSLVFWVKSPALLATVRVQGNHDVLRSTQINAVANLQWGTREASGYTRTDLPGTLQLINIVRIDGFKRRVAGAGFIAPIGVPV